MTGRHLHECVRLRVRVLPATAATLAAADSALAEAAEAAGGCSHFVEARGELIGLARVEVLLQTLFFEWLEVLPARRNLGLGGEAVLALERAHAGMREARARVPAGNGLAIYFWLRVGYRPLFGVSGDSARENVMLRTLG